MPPIPGKIAAFRQLHQPGKPFVIPNPWDAGSARILEGLGFPALATTSSGFALSLGRHDYGVTRDEAIGHGNAIASAVGIPVTADLENGFGANPEDAAETIRLALASELCGGSIEDSTGDKDNPIFDQTLAVERVAAAVEAKNSATRDFVLTARAEAFLYGRGEIDEIVARLNAYADAGADVLYAPGLPDMDAVRAICQNVSKPVNVLLYGKLILHRIEEFAEAGAARLSVGGGLAWSAYATLSSASAMIEDGDFSCLAGDRKSAEKVAAFLKS